MDITQRWTRQSLSVKIDCVLNALNERWRHILSIDCCYCTWLEKMIFPTKYTETYTTNTIENHLLHVSMKTVVMIFILLKKTKIFQSLNDLVLCLRFCAQAGRSSGVSVRNQSSRQHRSIENKNLFLVWKLKLHNMLPVHGV